MTRTIPEFALLSPSSRTKPTGRVTVNGPHTMELSFEAGLFQPRSQDFATADPLAVASFMASTDHCLRPLPSGFFLKLGGFFFEKYKVCFIYMTHTTQFLHGPYYPTDIEK
ncbi:hypothetical protein AVEN_61904-1 [Araneus ventricosus]|uniref:Uncharacterized protein n=1 Tax=Araneus ventricosus TaxID=182803 RepID=A0A4Y2RRL2_ARAVE|nr:hypothetical protein AVEN_61904-1 [Araneus ventricosus]